MQKEFVQQTVKKPKVSSQNWQKNGGYIGGEIPLFFCLRGKKGLFLFRRENKIFAQGKKNMPPPPHVSSGPPLNIAPSLNKKPKRIPDHVCYYKMITVGDRTNSPGRARCFDRQPCRPWTALQHACLLCSYAPVCKAVCGHTVNLSMAHEP